MRRFRGMSHCWICGHLRRVARAGWGLLGPLQERDWDPCCRLGYGTQSRRPTPFIWLSRAGSRDICTGLSPLPQDPRKVQPVDMAWGDRLRETARPVSLAVLPTCVSPCWPPLPFSLSHHLLRLTNALPPSLIKRKPGDPAKGFPLPPSFLGWEVNEAAVPNPSGEKSS